jgi:hypothetical protein
MGSVTDPLDMRNVTKSVPLADLCTTSSCWPLIVTKRQRSAEVVTFCTAAASNPRRAGRRFDADGRLDRV